MTFEEKLKYKGDIPIVAYFDFETIAPDDQQRIDSENIKMFAVSYVIICAFHPDLHINQVIIEGTFGHSLKRLVDLSYLMCKELVFKDEKTFLQLKYCMLAVHARNCKIAISEMFTTELKFAAACLLKRRNTKLKSKYLELSNRVKRKREIENSIDWLHNRCCIFPSLLEINATKFDIDNETLSYVDFIIFKEHTFLRNIFFRE